MKVDRGLDHPSLTHTDAEARPERLQKRLRVFGGLWCIESDEGSFISPDQIDSCFPRKYMPISWGFLPKVGAQWMVGSFTTKRHAVDILTWKFV